jgi:hypothetical protein
MVQRRKELLAREVPDVAEEVHKELRGPSRISAEKPFNNTWRAIGAQTE